MRRRIIAVAILVIAGSGFAWWWFSHNGAENGTLVLYGNVDLRQVDLAFNDSGRIAAVLVDEGAKVTAGEVVARLDTSRIEPQVAQAKAQVAAQAAAVDKLHNGSRPEEIGQARANVDAAQANADNLGLIYKRLTMLQATAGGRAAVTQSQIDAAKAGKDSADAQVRVAEQVLALADAGPRAEDVAQAEAQLDGANAQLALLEQQLKDAELAAPIASVVRSRLLEPGEIASPQRPVLSLAIVDPKWVRAYVSEPDLVRVAPGAEASVMVDGEPGQALSGHIGFISPVAEFTPRSIQTAELRTSLVYEVRVLVDDPDDALRLGMPATVRLAGNSDPADTAETRP
jgi:HlyD family secretion protein